MSHWQLKPGLWVFGEIDFLLVLNSLPYDLSNLKINVRFLHGKCLKTRPEYGSVRIKFGTKDVKLNISTPKTRHDTKVVYVKAT